MAGITLKGVFAFDTTVILEMLLGTPQGEALLEALASDSVIAYTSDVNMSEAGYILCRRLGGKVAAAKINALSRSNYISIIDAVRLRDYVIEQKCSRAIALADCYTLATAKVTGSNALFAFKEEELSREISRRPFDVQITFLR